MPGTIPNAGEKSFLELVRDGGAGAVNLRLFSNNLTVSDASVLTDITECNYNGYIPAPAASWSAVTTNGAGKAELKITNYTFTKTAGGTSNTVYGYYVTFDGMYGGQKLIGLEKFDTPRNMVNGGDTVTLTVTLTLSNVA